MNNVNKNDQPNLTILKQYIKDLSFENPQNPPFNESKINNNNLSVDLSFVYESFESNFFGVTIKYTCRCFSKIKKISLFHLELDYYGFFELHNRNDYADDILTKEAAKIIFPSAKKIVEDITQYGGSIPIILDNIDLNLVKT